MQEKMRMRTTAAAVNGRERGESGSRDRGSSAPARYLRAWTQAEAKIDAGGHAPVRIGKALITSAFVQ